MCICMTDMGGHLCSGVAVCFPKTVNEANSMSQRLCRNASPIAYQVVTLHWQRFWETKEKYAGGIIRDPLHNPLYALEAAREWQ